MNTINEIIESAETKIDGEAVIIYSGGQDSTTTLFWAKEKFSRVHAITFSYGQRHSEELNSADRICENLDIPILIVDISPIMNVTNSALLNTTDNINVLNSKGLPASFVPNRNQLFLTLAHSYAQRVGASYLVTGVCETDYSGYPDCRLEFIKSLEHTTNLGSAEGIKILTPLMNLDKADTFRLAQLLGGLDTVIDDTITCYNGDKTMHDWGMGCDNCPSCELRKKGFNEFIERYHRKDNTII